MAVKAEAIAVLEGVQAHASSPDRDVWLTASAGTGKTFVLAARVLRLLLRSGVRPDSILCLTFTRAGAAEMAERVHQRLASWVRMSESDLRKQLFALGEPHDADACAHARTLFASVLEARGGGLRVMTIHAFCQTLLATFPLEAGLMPGFRAIEGREQATLAAQVLSDLVTKAEHEGDSKLIGALGALSERLGEDAAQQFLRRSTRTLAVLEMLPDGIEARIRRALDVPAEFDETHVPAACAESAFDRSVIEALGGMHREWGTKTGLQSADRIAAWLQADPAGRAATLADLSAVWLTNTGTIRKGPRDEAYPELVERLNNWCAELLALEQRARLAGDIAHALHAGRRHARAYADAKSAAGLVDFDDLIARAVALLSTDGMGDWIRYKLDQATDHILVDEAQDTNLDQWQIVAALASEFWAGEGARDGVLRTLFTVGDFKQAIFGFQGTDPLYYEAAGIQFQRTAAEAGREIARLTLSKSFRSTPPVLDVVDALIEELGTEALGAGDHERHVSAAGGSGRVALLPPVTARDSEDDEGEEGWIATSTRMLASDIARQVRRWLDEPLMLDGRGRPRALSPGDVMILVRKRSDLASLLVARLQAEKIPVAGVDRLRLAAPLGVQDCLAAMRFAAQPEDDLTLATLLVSPILGWSQDELYDAASLPRSGTLWRHLRATQPQERLAILYDLLAAADRMTPFEFFERMLSGPIAARAKLLRRLGNEASDPIDELLNAAMAFEREGIATIQEFLDWFDRGESEVVRDPGGSGDVVRVMTVHAAKGLQAPLVILADACSDPDQSTDRDFTWYLDGDHLPLFRPRTAERALVASLEASARNSADQERREHWRLLYVAMTRAEEQLIIAGALTPRQKDVPAASWYAAVDRAMKRLGAAEDVDPHWGAVRAHGVPAKRGVRSAAPPIVPLDRPEWLKRPAPAEARPSRPLAPSAIGIDDVADPPTAQGRGEAAERGRIIHALLERLPGIQGDRRAVALRWLERSAGVTDAGSRADLTDAAMSVIDHPALATLFSPMGMAEVPIAGVVEGNVIAGRVDRLLVNETTVDLVDFKTGRRAPPTLDRVPTHHVSQIAAYVAVLQSVFPDHEVRASLIYTAGPIVHVLPPELVEANKPRLFVAEHNLSSGR